MTTILICGCGDPYGFSKDFQLTTIDEAKGYTVIELSGMGELPLANGSPTDDYLIVKKINYYSLPVYYQLLFQRHSSTNYLSPKRLVFLIDKQRYILTFLGSDKSDTSEWAWILVEPSFLKKIADAKKVSFSVEGSDKTIDYIFNERYLYCFKRFYKECVLPDEKLGIPGNR